MVESMIHTNARLVAEFAIVQVHVRIQCGNH